MLACVGMGDESVRMCCEDGEFSLSAGQHRVVLERHTGTKDWAWNGRARFPVWTQTGRPEMVSQAKGQESG